VAIAELHDGEGGINRKALAPRVPPVGAGAEERTPRATVPSSMRPLEEAREVARLTGLRSANRLGGDRLAQKTIVLATQHGPRLAAGVSRRRGT
jgi:hypothetical protein